MQGGAIAENAIVPMNLLRGHAGADYIDTGEWSKKSIKEAKKYAKVNVAASAADSGYTTIPPRDDLEARPRRRLRAHLQQRDHRRRRIPLHARRRQRAAGGRHVQQHPVAPGGRVAVRPDLRRRAEEHRPGGADHRHRARRPARPGAAGHAVGLRLQDRGRQRQHVQHAADLRDLYRRPGVQVAPGAGRAGGDGGEEPRQGRAALRLPGHHLASTARRWRGLPQPDERALQAEGRSAGRAPS